MGGEPVGCNVITVGHIAPVESRWRGAHGNTPTLLYVGTNNASNVQALTHFIAQSLPLLRAHMPTLELHVAGKVCLALEEHAGVVKHGVVDDLAPLYANAGIVINPVLFGTGLKIKNVEALSLGCPLVTTPIGAEGLEEGLKEEGDNNAFVIAEPGVDFAEAIHALLRDHTRAQTLADAGMALVRRMNARSSTALLDALAQPATDDMHRSMKEATR